MKKNAIAEVELCRDNTLWMHVRSEGGLCASLNLKSVSQAFIVPKALLAWAYDALNRDYTEAVERLECGHPKQSLGRVHSPTEDEHCLWCGDLTDLRTVLDHIQACYIHMSGGKVSKPMTRPDVVIAMDNDRTTEIVEEAVKDKDEEWREAIREHLLGIELQGSEADLSVVVKNLKALIA